MRLRSPSLSGLVGDAVTLVVAGPAIAASRLVTETDRATRLLTAPARVGVRAIGDAGAVAAAVLRSPQVVGAISTPARSGGHIVSRIPRVVRTVTDPRELAHAARSSTSQATRVVTAIPRTARFVVAPAAVATTMAVHPRRAADVLIRHHERRVVDVPGRIHVELRPTDDIDDRARGVLDHRLEARVAAIDGVEWAQVRAPFRRLVVQFDELADRDVVAASVTDAVDEFELRQGVRDVPFSERDHPGDDAPIARDILGIGADLIGISLGSALQLLRLRPPPIEIDLAAAVNVADQVIPVRRRLEGRFGEPLVDVTVGFTNAILQGAVQGPLGPMVDLGRRVLVLRELDGRRALWLRREAELFGRPVEDHAHLLRPDRPRAVPDGAIERYERFAVGTSAVTGAATLLLTRRLERAASMVQATLPKAAKLGREGFVREFAHHLASRGVLVVEPGALDLLDRVDCLAVAADLLGPGGVDLAGLVTAAQRGGIRVLVEVPPGEHTPAGADGIAPGSLATAIVDAQAAGHVVALATAGTGAGSLVADLALGISLPGEPVPWASHLIGTDDTADVILLLEAILQARRVTHESVRLAAIGAGGAAIVALGNVMPRRFERVPSIVSVASALSLVNGLRHAYDVARRPLPIRMDPTPWHALDIDVVLDRLGTGALGLTTEAATARHVSEPTPPPLPIAFGHAVADELVNPLTPVLAGGAVMSVLVGSIVDAALVSGVVGANALVGGVQNLRSQRAIQALSRTHPSEVTVMRDGRPVALLHRHVVQGDVIQLQAGQAVPADCRIIRATSLEVDESALTGESLPVPKGPAPVDAPVLAERSSMLYEASWIAAGEAVAVVVATGDQTEAARAVLLAGEPPASGVEARLRSWTGRMVPIALLGGGAVVLNGFARGRPLSETLGAGVSLAVAAVPEGLPLLSTVAQLAAARRLSRRNVLVRNARAIEALGRVDVVCADKTGTLTEGRITLRVVSDGTREGNGGELTPALRQVLATAVRATPVADDPTRLAHPTDRAVAEGGHVNGAGADWEPDGELAFEPGRGYHASTGVIAGHRVMAVKGAPEVVVPKCVRRRLDGHDHVIGHEERADLEHHVHSLARRGLRVLAVAETTIERGDMIDELALPELTFVGLLGLADPARTSSADAIGLLRTAGVRVLMITGDHPSTAEAIGAELGLVDGASIVTGEQIDAVSDDDLVGLLESAAVFARVTPSHKVRIVRALQRAGHTVAMTGDGANDAPAIRLADVGIALGSRATPAARGAADIVVLDERIETIVDALIEGRALWGAVRDAVAVLVGGNLGEIAFTVLGSLLTARPPLNARQLLLVNLLTDAAPALAIAARPPRAVRAEQLLEEGPDASLAAALDRAIAWRAGTTAAATLVAWGLTGPIVAPRRAGTTALVTTVATQLGQTIMTSRRDPVVLLAGVGSAAVLVGIVQTPGLSQLFGCTPLDPLALSIAGTVATGASVAAQIVPGLVHPR
jgi:cation-transporting P-type ATPase I